MTPDEQLLVFRAGWAAMKWLAKHTKANDCPDCRVYHKLVALDRRPAAVLEKRCALARRMHEQYVAVERMLAAQAPDVFECDLVDPKRPDIHCDGPAEWVLAECSRRNGRMIGYFVGCATHVKHAEARAITSGSSGTFRIEKLEDLAPEDARKMW